jgi:4-hydroxy 2-oxovalerate aldolase
MLQLKKDGVVWGYDVPYLVTGYLNQHPRAAMAFSKDKRTDYSKFFDEVIAQE